MVAHPGYSPRNPEGTKFRGLFDGNDEVREAKPFVARDRDIVDETDRLLAGPAGRTEERFSGTWTTVRYARRKGKPIDILYPAK